MNFAAITRRIRRCESEVPAQLVLEYAIAQAVAAEREECAKYVELVRDDWVKADANTKACAADYLAHAIRTRPNFENVRWATKAEQSRNQRRNVWLETPLGRLLLVDALLLWTEAECRKFERVDHG